MNSQQYWKEVTDTAEWLVKQAMTEYGDKNDREAAEEVINDHLLHETIDGHQWVIYYTYSLDVMKYSGNTDYLVENFGAEDAGTILAEGGTESLHQAIAFWAMYADVQEELEQAFDDYIGQLPEEQLPLYDGNTDYDKNGLFLVSSFSGNEWGIIKLEDDDGSDCPFFKSTKTGNIGCEYWSDLEVYNPEKEDN